MQLSIKRFLAILVIVGVVVCLLVALGNALLARQESEPEPVTEPVAEEPQSGYAWQEFLSGGRDALCGVDVSEHQQAVDWPAVRAGGAQFAMIRMGYRGYTNGGLFADEHFRFNVESALSAGLAVGVYFFSQAISVEEAEEEARFVLDALDGLDIRWPIAYDWESVEAEARTDGLDGRTMTDCALAFCRVIREAGYTPAIYTNRNQSMLYTGYAGDALDDIVLWLADYTDAPTVRFDFALWQYTDAGTLPGVEGTIDLNYSFVDFGR